MNKTIKSFRQKKHQVKQKYLQIVAAGDIDKIPVCISKGNRKIGHALNVSLLAIDTCGGCISGRCKCWEICYDIRSCVQYPNVMDARVRNTIIAMNQRDRYFKAIDDAMRRRRKNKMFRYHVGGEIPDRDYLERMIKTAKDHPDFKVWTYTKVYHVVNDYIRETGGADIFIPKRDGHPKPGQIVIMFSEWRGYPMDNPYGLPEFRVVFKDDIVRPVGFYCPGNCDICKKHCRGCIAGETVYADEH